MEKIITTYEEYQKAFVAGTQNIYWDDAEDIAETEVIRYYWQHLESYNLLKALVKGWENMYPNSEKIIYGRNSLLDTLIPYQRRYNSVMNQYMNAAFRFEAPICTVEDGSIDIDELSEEGLAPGKILIYRQGAQAPYFEPIVSREDLKALREVCHEAYADFFNAANMLEFAFLKPELNKSCENYSIPDKIEVINE